MKDILAFTHEEQYCAIQQKGTVVRDPQRCSQCLDPLKDVSKCQWRKGEELSHLIVELKVRCPDQVFATWSSVVLNVSKDLIDGSRNDTHTTPLWITIHCVRLSWCCLSICNYCCIIALYLEKNQIFFPKKFDSSTRTALQICNGIVPSFALYGCIERKVWSHFKHEQMQWHNERVFNLSKKGKQHISELAFLGSSLYKAGEVLIIIHQLFNCTWCLPLINYWCGDMVDLPLTLFHASSLLVCPLLKTTMKIEMNSLLKWYLKGRSNSLACTILKHFILSDSRAKDFVKWESIGCIDLQNNRDHIDRYLVQLHKHISHHSEIQVHQKGCLTRQDTDSSIASI